MIILNRLEKFASQAGYFSEMQFEFQVGSCCIKASFTLLEAINHMLERGSKMFSCFLDVQKAFDTVWIDGLMYKLFSDLGVSGKLWLANKDLYTDVKARGGGGAGFYLGFLCWRGSQSRKKFVPRGGKKKLFLGLLGGSGGMLPWKILKI